ncbi:hypothetical protein RI129_009179 [Pyrocoelia pectoralis]|uniref:Sulfotransferase domain-containing protein n=1 Tax=Pyrocoelia pectoralis TaxID=417401 RepID=A0AAN7ZI27_9COLE
MNYIRKIEGQNELNRMVNELYKSQFSNNYIEMGPTSMFMPESYGTFYKTVREFKVEDDDIFVTGYPKSGTRWVDEMVWLIVNNQNFELARSLSLRRRITLLESDGFSNEKVRYMDTLLNMKRSRLIKTHLHWGFWPDDITTYRKKPKIIVVHRQPEDVCLSQFHHNRTTRGFIGSFDDYCTLFLNGKVSFGPYWEQVLSIWEQRDKANIIFIKYKEMKENLPAVIGRVAKFLGKHVPNEKIPNMIEHLSFESLKSSPGFNEKETLAKYNADCNPYIREGKIGGYAAVMNPDIISKFKEMNCLKLFSVGISFD